MERVFSLLRASMVSPSSPPQCEHCDSDLKSTSADDGSGWRLVTVSTQRLLCLSPLAITQRLPRQTESSASSGSPGVLANVWYRQRWIQRELSFGGHDRRIRGWRLLRDHHGAYEFRPRGCSSGRIHRSGSFNAGWRVICTTCTHCLPRNY